MNTIKLTIPVLEALAKEDEGGGHKGAAGMNTSPFRHNSALALLLWVCLASLSWGQGIIGSGGIIGGRSAGAGILYTPACAEDFANEIPWVWIQNRENPAKAYQFTFDLNTNIRAIAVTLEGTARPAWHAPMAADRVSGSVTAFTSAANTTYRSFYAADGYEEWDVPASAEGADTLLVWIVGHTSGGKLDVTKNPGGSEVIIGTVETLNGSVARAQRTVDITGNELAEGDILRFDWTAGESDTCRLATFIAYDSDGAITNFGDQFWFDGTDPALVAGSSIEFAVEIAPTGSATKLAGGYAHQAQAANCTEINVLETWYKNGAEWAPQPGWQTGAIHMDRTSDIDYDLGPTVIASAAYTYTLRRQYLGMQYLITTSVITDIDSAFGPMAPFVPTGETITLSDGNTLTTTPNDSSSVFVSAETQDSITSVSSITTGGDYAVLIWSNATHPLENLSAWLPATYDKMYVNIGVIGDGAASGTAWGATSRIEFRESPR